MRKLLSHKKYRDSFILNIAGVIFTVIGWLLNELYLADKLIVGGSNLILVGIILWSIGEANLVHLLLKEQEDEK
jgi:nicotinamide riboside transporter PnuC